MCTEIEEIVDICKAILLNKKEDQVKEKEEWVKIEKEQKLTTQYDLHWKMKEQCIMSLGEDMYNRIYHYLKKSKEEPGDFFTVQSQLKDIVGSDKEKMNKVFLIDQIIECEKNKNYFV